MADRHSTHPKAVRLPDGLEVRVKEAAEADGETVNGFIVAAIEERLERRAGGSTAPVSPLRPRNPRTNVPPVAFAAGDLEQSAPTRKHHPACKCLTCKPPKNGDKR